jgi:hypothetical protein
MKIIAEKAITSIGKQRADPIEANFRKETILPDGSSLQDDRLAITASLTVGQGVKASKTKDAKTRSLASDRSIVA